MQFEIGHDQAMAEFKKLRTTAIQRQRCGKLSVRFSNTTIIPVAKLLKHGFWLWTRSLVMKTARS